MMKLLFDIEETPLPEIAGLEYVPDFISPEQEVQLLKRIDAQPWLTDLKRCVQHYGYQYDYRARIATQEQYLGPLPEWLAPLAQKLDWSQTPDQAIVNEYAPGQGISAHIDCRPCFGDTIASLSLGAGAIMQFIQPQTGEKHEIYLEPRSLLTLSGEARYEWQHAIPARKSDTISGFKIPRTRRVSVTFRTMHL